MMVGQELLGEDSAAAAWFLGRLPAGLPGVSNLPLPPVGEAGGDPAAEMAPADRGWRRAPCGLPLPSLSSPTTADSSSVAVVSGELGLERD